MAARVSFAPHMGTVAMGFPVAGFRTCRSSGKEGGSRARGRWRQPVTAAAATPHLELLSIGRFDPLATHVTLSLQQGAVLYLAHQIGGRSAGLGVRR